MKHERKQKRDKKPPVTFKELFGEKRKAALFALIDTLLFYASFALAYFLDTLNVTPTLYEFGHVMLLALPCSILTLVIMIVQKQYLVVWRYAGMMELLRLSVVDFVSLVVGMVVRGLYTFTNLYVPNSLVVIASYLMFFLFCVAYRVAGRMGKAGLQVFNKFRSRGERVIVYGAGYTGAALVKRLV
ncbi:MAG: hypothetical protein IJ735_02225, partial [Clostridia bacterium]|nr:hypothetical protein [Clostridia bacterium]